MRVVDLPMPRLHAQDSPMGFKLIFEGPLNVGCGVGGGVGPTNHYNTKNIAWPPCGATYAIWGASVNQGSESNEDPFSQHP